MSTAQLAASQEWLSSVSKKVGNRNKEVKVKKSLFQAVEAHRVARG
jgi:hypothetical protein